MHVVDLAAVDDEGTLGVALEGAIVGRLWKSRDANCLLCRHRIISSIALYT